MRPALLLLAASVVAAVAACGASAGGRTPIVFGTTGGNLAGYHVTIQPNGSVRLRGRGWKFHKQIRPARVRQLRRDIRRANLASRVCPGTLPDFASKFIRVGGRTFQVRGGCEPRFRRVFDALVSAVALRPSSG
ncbi:MAG TPA: hypothetical protein VFN33_01970 [Gaiellaceae bacterium]|nr:hypothetical protein [Gaiellaceae bacterium]